MNKLGKGITAGGVLLLLAVAAWAGAGDRGHGPRSFHFMPPGEMSGMPIPTPGMAMTGGVMMVDPMHLLMLAERLELDTAQREAIGRVMDETAPRMRELLFRAADSRKALQALMEQDEVPEKSIRELADRQGRLHADLLFTGLKARTRIRALLSEEQRARLDEPGGEGPGMFHHRLH